MLKQLKTTNEVKRIDQILALIYDPLFVQFELKKEAPSIFNAVGRTYTERWHSALLGWLFDPKSSHELGIFPLTCILLFLSNRDTLSVKKRGIDLSGLLVKGDFSEAQVRPNERESAEVSVGNMRFDVLINGIKFNPFKDVQILIEVKVNDKIKPKQCGKYIDYIALKKVKKVFTIPVFVAPTSKMLGTPNELFGNESWFGIDFQSIYDEVIEPCLQHPLISDFGIFTLTEYIKTLKYPQKGGDPLAITQKEFDMVHALFEKHEPAIRAMYEILSQRNDDFEPIAPDNHQTRKLIKLKMGKNIIEGSSVTKLYNQALKFLHKGGYLDNLELPITTSQFRYLIAKEPKHQRGNDFINPVEYNNYFMEANKSRATAVNDLFTLIELCGLTAQLVE